jgi:glutamyl-tRNA synthetase
MKKAKVPHLVRWFSFCSSLKPFADVIAMIPKSADSRKQHGVYHDLPGAEMGKVVTRFPPEPSGFLHIGHCKAAMLNAHYAKLYDGKLILRFDDTNPTKEKDEYAENIKRDLETLGIVPDRITHSSDYFDLCIQHAEDLINRGLAFCDSSTGEEIAKQREKREPSPFRDALPAENMARWTEMKSGTPEGKKWVLRAKVDYASLNGTMRDPAIYRVVLDPPHLRTGTKYKVYPLYDFVCPIVDSIEGVTHAQRSNEYHDRNEQFYWMIKAMNLRPVLICDFARLNFAYQLLSKRKLQWFVDNGVVPTWDDPRFPTIQGLMRRGVTKEALWEFILAEGASKNVVLMDMAKLWAINKRLIDPIVPRYTAIAKDGAVKFELSGGPAEVDTVVRPRHKKNSELGNKAMLLFKTVFLEQEDAQRLKLGEEVTLMDWGNAIVDDISKDAAGVVTSVKGRLHLAGDFKKTEAKLTWLADVPEHMVDVKLLDYDYLITKDKLEKDEKFQNFLRETTTFETHCFGDMNLRNLHRGDRIQLERRGYFIVEQVAFKGPLVLVQIPDGKVSGPSILSKKVQVPPKHV